MVMTYEKNILCSIKNICSTRLSCHMPLPPGHEEVKDTLHEMYATLMEIKMYNSCATYTAKKWNFLLAKTQERYVTMYVKTSHKLAKFNNGKF